jgi:hypothetical protein
MKSCSPPVKRSLGERLFGAEVTEKDSVSSKRISIQSETPQDLRPFFPRLAADARALGGYVLKSGGHRGRGRKKS